MDDFRTDEIRTIHHLNRILKQKERNSIFNHLKSIQHDSKFVLEVLGAYRTWAQKGGKGAYPCYANRRNGLWYAPKHEWDGTCYFKSTDGHSRHWNFATTRLNLHVAGEASRAGGCIVVDSTRRGKDCPDSMTATIPIWCAVLNRFFFGMDETETADCLDKYWSMAELAPPWLDPSSIDQIQSQIPSWCQKLEELRDTITAQLGLCGMRKPLYPVWVLHSQFQELGSGMDGTRLPGQYEMEEDLEYLPVICISASQGLEQQALHRVHHSWTYIQGAGDDEENWAEGLTPNIFWENCKSLLEVGDDNEKLVELIHRLVEHRKTLGAPALIGCNDSENPIYSGVWELGNTGLALGTFDWAKRTFGTQPEQQSLIASQWADCIVIALGEDSMDCEKMPCQCLNLEVREGKRAHPPDYWQVHILPSLLAFFSHFQAELQASLRALSSQHAQPSAKGFSEATLNLKSKCFLICKTGTELSAFAAVAILLAYPRYTREDSRSFMSKEDFLFCNNFQSHVFLYSCERRVITKSDVQQKMMFVQNYQPYMQIPRRLCKELNNFFIPSHGGWNSLKSTFTQSNHEET